MPVVCRKTQINTSTLHIFNQYPFYPNNSTQQFNKTLFEQTGKSKAFTRALLSVVPNCTSICPGTLTLVSTGVITPWKMVYAPTTLNFVNVTVSWMILGWKAPGIGPWWYCVAFSVVPVGARLVKS